MARAVTKAVVEMWGSVAGVGTRSGARFGWSPLPHSADYSTKTQPQKQSWVFVKAPHVSCFSAGAKHLFFARGGKVQLLKESFKSQK